MTKNAPQLYQTGAEPEFFVRHIAKFETAATGVSRLYWASERAGILRLEFTMIASVICLREMASNAWHIANDPLWELRKPDGLGMH